MVVVAFLFSEKECLVVGKDENIVVAQYAQSSIPFVWFSSLKSVSRQVSACSFYAFFHKKKYTDDKSFITVKISDV